MVKDRDALLRRGFIEIASDRSPRLRRTHFLARTGGREHYQTAVWHMAQVDDGAAEINQVGKPATCGLYRINGVLVGAGLAQREAQMRTVGCPGGKAGPALLDLTAGKIDLGRALARGRTDHELTHRWVEGIDRFVAFDRCHPLAVG